MRRRATPPALLAAVAACLSGAPAFAGPALDALTPVADIAVVFKNSALDPDDKSLRAILKGAKKATRPTCYWIARGPSGNEAKAIRAALGDAGIAPERVIVEAVAAPASIRIYCEAPPGITIAFAPGESTLSDAARDDLELAALVILDAPKKKNYVIEGDAGPSETADARRLSLERAIVARAWLVSRGVPAARLTFHSGESGDAAVTIKLK